MSWFDEAVARRQREQRSKDVANANAASGSVDPLVKQQREVETFDPLIQRLLSEYGEHVFGKGLLQKRFLVRLERPGKTREKAWNWHWHLDNLVKNANSVELHPNFASNNTIQGFVLLSGQKRIEVPATDDVAIKEGLVSLYMEK